MTATEVEQILDWLEIENMDWHRKAGVEGVDENPVAGSGRHSSAGLTRIKPGSSLANHTHRLAAHDLLMLEGTARIGQRWLPAGGFAFHTAGDPHGLD
jgi:quercetin dioxygenase-like cupin family protein